MIEGGRGAYHRTVPLDPQAQALLDQLAALGNPSLDELPVVQARETFATFAALGGPGPALPRVEDRTVPGPGGDVAVRVYEPGTGKAPRPFVMWFHGGGMVIGSVAEHDGFCRALADASGAIVVSVEYRLAPENRYPAAVEDCYAATAWVREHGAELGGDPRRLAVGGDSAGGNLAAVTALLARERKGPPLLLQILVYPMLDSSLSHPSMRELGEGHLLTSRAVAWFWGHYLGDDGDGRDPIASPEFADDLAGLPPALVITAEYDPLRDEGEAYALRLEQAGVPLTASRYSGQLHSFATMGALFDASAISWTALAEALRGAFSS
jgi:acetyl esterase